MQTLERTKVFVVEDSAAIRHRLIEILDDIDGAEFVGEAESPDAAIAGILAARPDCVVLDYRLLGGTGVDVLRAVRPVLPETLFIVLTNHPNPQYRRICMQAGASWFFDKSTEFARVKEIIAEFRSTKDSRPYLASPSSSKG
jgi:two-component system, NarL family, response regulator DevR